MARTGEPNGLLCPGRGCEVPLTGKQRACSERCKKDKQRHNPDDPRTPEERARDAEWMERNIGVGLPARIGFDQAAALQAAREAELARDLRNRDKDRKQLRKDIDESYDRKVRGRK